MSWYRVYALIIRHLLPLKRDFDLLTDLIYWPFVDVVTWGLASQWLTKTNSALPNLVLSILIAIVIWNIIWRSQSEVARNLIDEIWNNNLINMFASPLQLREWIFSVLILSLIKIFLAATFVTLAILALYSINVFIIGWYFLPFAICAAMTGWAVGFVSAGIVIRYGQKIQTVIWTLPGILFPLSAVYFPVSQLPPVIKQLSQLVPTTYIFETMRDLAFNNHADNINILYSLILNIIYIVLAVLFFRRMFKKSKELNLARLQN